MIDGNDRSIFAGPILPAGWDAFYDRVVIGMKEEDQRLAPGPNGGIPGRVIDAMKV
jgi:hypothetical protein